MYLFLSGALMTAFFVAAVFFWRFWRRTSDRFFLMFAGAWVLLGVERLVLGIMNQPEQLNPGIYFIRLAAFLLIIIAIIDKNRTHIRS
ncbi:MAG TPA: DUF5985 family protein [Candidatus Baltobacteraceae bacterium]|nr:DUF5985 family protein [Candidatus Baltobacteraceae bacterium]